MKYARTTLAALLIATLGVPAAQAQTEKTREQVRAELAEAMRSGSLAASGEIGLPQNALNPQRYAKPGPHPAAGATRSALSWPKRRAAATSSPPAKSAPDSAPTFAGAIRTSPWRQSPARRSGPKPRRRSATATCWTTAG